MSRELLCQSCGEQKMSLQKFRSSLIREMELTMCATCIEKKYEPRFVIILAVRSPTIGMNETIKKVISDRRYIGEVIAASDIL